MKVKIEIETENPVPYKTTDLSTTLENVECIGDLKKKLERLLHVAARDMSVYYKNRLYTSQKLENEENMSSLYVREGDTFVVKFLSVCNLPFFSELLEHMRAFVNKVCEAFSAEESIKGFQLDQDTASVIDYCYKNVMESLEECSNNMFTPWSQHMQVDLKPTPAFRQAHRHHFETSENRRANRHYFVQEGGLRLLRKIYDFASRKEYRSERYSIYVTLMVLWH